MAGELCKCGARHDGWPGDAGGELCQMCWEAACSESWWAMVAGLLPLYEARERLNRERERRRGKRMKRGMKIGLLMALLMTVSAVYAQGAVLPTPTQHKTTLTWTNACDASITCSFNVYKCAGSAAACPTSGSSWNLLTLTPITSAQYVDLAVTAGATASYVVYSTATINGVLQTSTPSNEVSATTPLGPAPVTVTSVVQ
jgi:hypothetical protein